MIPIYKPSIKRKEMDALLSTLVSDYIDSGNNYSDFLKALTSFLEFEGGALLRDYSRAIEVVLSSLELESGSRILISPLAPSAYMRILRKFSYTVVYADVDPFTGAISDKELEESLKHGVDAIVLSSPAGVRPEYEFLSEYDIPVIEDITTTITPGKGNNEQPWIPDYAILRMELQDIITSGEGTAVFGADKKNMGFLKNRLSELSETSFLLNMHAAMGHIQLDSIDHFLERRREIGKIFEASLLKGNHKTFHSPEESERNYPGFYVVLNCPVKEVSRYARKNGVMMELAFSNSSIAEDTEETDNCPVARSLLPRTAVFPLYPGLGTKNTQTISKLLSTLP